MTPILRAVIRFGICFTMLVGTGLSGQKTSEEPISVEIDTNKHAAYTIPRTIFGSFLEPIGNSINNGLWAQILQNPSFEHGLWSAAAVARMIRDQPSLAEASEVGLPLPWEPLDARQRNRYEPRWGDAANSWRSLAIFGLPESETGIKQQVFLPVHRELEYNGSIYLKHLSGADGVGISIRRRNQPREILARAEIEAPAGEWRKYGFALRLTAGSLQSLEPSDFVISVERDERVLVDQVELMPADSIDGLDPEMVALGKAMHTSVLRFGGNFTSAYHWRDGVGPRDKRVTMLNIAWGIPEYNQFGTDEFLRFCELIGAQPQIALNLGSGTPQEAADWVRYVDEHSTKHAGLLWELGNELWGNWNVGYPTLAELPQRTRAFSEAIRAVDPKARLIATGQDVDAYKVWNAAQLTNPPDTFDFLSTHFVVTTNQTVRKNSTQDAIAEDTFALPLEIGRKLREMQAQIDETPFRNKAHLAFTEWLFGCCWERIASAPRYDNMGGAVAAGSFWNMLIRNADVVPIADMTGIIEFAGIWKKRGRVYATPAYYTFRLYSTAEIEAPIAVANDSGHYDVHEGITRLPEIPNVPYLDVIAALNHSGSRLTIFCVNRHLNRDTAAAISIRGFSARPTGVVQTLRAGSIYEVNDELRPDFIKPIESTVPIHDSQLEFTFRHESVTRIELQRQ